MGKGSLRSHRTANGGTRNYVAIDSHFRSTAGPMGKLGKGRTRKDQASRQSVKASLRGGAA